jgi:ribosomal protein L40E
MPLIECPDCHSDVSSHAESCPKCGYPISLRNKENEEEEIEEVIYAKPERKKGGGGLFLASLCIGIIGLFFWPLLLVAGLLFLANTRRMSLSSRSYQLLSRSALQSR